MVACKQHQKKSQRTHYSHLDSSSGDHEYPYLFYCGNEVVVELIRFGTKSKWFRFLFLEQLCRSCTLYVVMYSIFGDPVMSFEDTTFEWNHDAD